MCVGMLMSAPTMSVAQTREAERQYTVEGTVEAVDQANRTVTIRLQNEDHTSVVRTWKLRGARIIKHTSGPLNAKGTDVAMEELVLAYERLEMA